MNIKNILNSNKTLFLQELAANISPSQKFKVKKYYAIATSLAVKGSGPLSIGGDGEVVLLLWLNPNNVPVNPDDIDDGIILYDKFTADRLLSQSATTDPSIHPDFLSLSGSLDINMTARFPNAAVEIIPRINNRLVVIAPKRPFAIVSPGKYANMQFSSKTALVLVIVLSQSK